jgi:hypothetical protein
MKAVGPQANDAELARLLQTADAEYSIVHSAPSAAALCNVARRRRSRSRRMRAASSALGATLIVAIIAASGLKTSQPIAPSAASRNAAAELSQILNALDREAKQRRQVVLALRRSEQLAEQQAELHLLASESSATSTVVEASRSAAISLQYAKLVERESQDAEQAYREYERVVLRFPGTPWADVAAASLQRLSSLSHPSVL